MEVDLSIVSECFVVQSPVTSQGVFVGRNAYRSTDEAVEVVYYAAVPEAPDTQQVRCVATSEYSTGNNTNANINIDYFIRCGGKYQKIQTLYW